MWGIDPEVLGFVAGCAVIALVWLAYGLALAAGRHHPRPHGRSNAAPAPVPPSRVPARAYPTAGQVLLCATNGHVSPDWAVDAHGNPFCVRCTRVLRRAS